MVSTIVMHGVIWGVSWFCRWNTFISVSLRTYTQGIPGMYTRLETSKKKNSTCLLLVRFWSEVICIFSRIHKHVVVSNNLILVLRSIRILNITMHMCTSNKMHTCKSYAYLFVWPFALMYRNKWLTNVFKTRC